jgi:hypothetical protein
VPHELEIVWLVLRRDQRVAHEEVDEDETAVGLELAALKGRDCLGHREELYIV